MVIGLSKSQRQGAARYLLDEAVRTFATTVYLEAAFEVWHQSITVPDDDEFRHYFLRFVVPAHAFDALANKDFDRASMLLYVAKLEAIEKPPTFFKAGV